MSSIKEISKAFVDDGRRISISQNVQRRGNRDERLNVASEASMVMRAKLTNIGRGEQYRVNKIAAEYELQGR